MADERVSIFEPELKTDFLDSFQEDGLDYLYNLEPTADNLFWAGNFSTFNSSDTSPKVKLNDIILPNAQFRIKGISFDNVKLKTTYDEKHTKMVFVNGVDAPNSIKISFIDDAYRNVRRYHMDWIKFWYHRKHDVFRVGPYGKLRGLDLVLFHYISGAEAGKEGKVNDLFSTPVVEPILGIKIRGLIPEAGPGWTFDTSNSNNEGVIEYSYKMTNAPQYIWFDAEKSAKNNSPMAKEDNTKFISQETRESISGKSAFSYDQGQKGEFVFA